MKLYNHKKGKYFNVKIISQHDISKDVKLLLAQDDSGDISIEFAIVYYIDGTYFVTDSWTWLEKQPTSFEEIAKYKWIDHWGQEAIMQDGLPVICPFALESVLTAAEAEREWNLKPSTVRAACLHERFRKEEARRSGRDWLVTVAGMERLYGPMPSVK
jgi:hypothetical protein